MERTGHERAQVRAGERGVAAALQDEIAVPDGAVALALAVSIVALSPLAGQPPKGKKYALLVGVSYYKNVYYSPLKGTENDVVELAKVLRQSSSGFEVTLLTSTPGPKDPALAPTAARPRAASATQA